MSAGTLATCIAVAFAVMSAWAGWWGRQQVSRRAMAMCALFAGIAVGLLLTALWRADLSVAFVSRHVILADAPLARLFAVFSDAAGTGLVASVFVAGSAWLADRAGWFSSGPGIGGVVVLILLAAPLSAGALSTLPFLPLDGAGSARFFSHPLAIVSFLSVLAVVSLASIALVASIGTPSPSAARARSRIVTGALLASGVAALAWTTGGAAIGALRQVDPVVARGGQWLSLLMVWAAVASRVTRPTVIPPAVELFLAGALASIGAVLGSGTTDAGADASRVLLALAIAVLIVTSWREGASSRAGLDLISHHAEIVALAAVATLMWAPSPAIKTVLLAGVTGAFVPRLLQRHPIDWSLVALCIVIASMAGAAGSLGRDEEMSIAPGTSIEAGGVTLAHQGVSTYEDGTTTVLGLALEATPGGSLSRAEQREDVDARGAVMRPVWYVPAQFTTMSAARHVWLERVDARERATVTLVTRPLAWLWAAALLPLVVLLLRRTPDREGV